MLKSDSMAKIQKGKRKGKLANALLHHQLVNSKKFRTETAKLEKKLTKSDKANRQVQLANPKTFIPFDKDSKILLVGEGDFSFTLSIIADHHIPPTNIIATSYDSLSELSLKYPHSFPQIHSKLKDLGVTIHFNVDATRLVKSMKLKKGDNLAVTHIIFNFPHTGRGIKDQDRNIRDHQLLVLGYFKSSLELFNLAATTHSKLASDLNITSKVAPEPKIIISVFEGEPYDLWSIKALSKTVGLQVKRSGSFDWEAFPAYAHKRTNSEQDTTKKAKERKARIYIFEKFKKTAGKTKKKEDSDGDDDYNE